MRNLMKAFQCGLLVASVWISASAWGKNVTFEVDPGKSSIEWIGSKVIGSQHNGTIQIKSGAFAFQDGLPQRGEIIVDMKTIVDKDLTDPKWNKKLVGHLESSDFFDVAKFPESRLVVERIQKVNDKLFRVQGQLTIKGKTKELAFTSSVLQAETSTMLLAADLEIDRTDFDVRYGSGKFFDNLGDKMISDKIQLKVRLFITGPGYKTAQL